MVPGFNHNVKYKGQVFHVQTEDSGLENPHIITHLFIGGNIIKSQKTSYNDLLGADDITDKVKQLMQAQHKQMLRSLVSGAFDDKIAERSVGASMLNGPAPLNVEHGQDSSSNMMSLLGAGSGAEEAPVKQQATTVAKADTPAVVANVAPAEPAKPVLNEVPKKEVPATQPPAPKQVVAPVITPPPTKPKPVMPPPSTVPKISDLGPIHRAPTSAASGMAAAAANLAAMQSSGSHGERLAINMGNHNFQVMRPTRGQTEEPSIFDLPPATSYDRISRPKPQPVPAPVDRNKEQILDGDSLNNVYQNNPDAIDNLFGSSTDSSLDDVLLGYLLSVEQS